EPVVGVLPHGAGVEHDHVGLGAVLGAPVAGVLEQAGQALGVVDVHLAPVGADLVRARHDALQGNAVHPSVSASSAPNRPKSVAEPVCPPTRNTGSTPSRSAGTGVGPEPRTVAGRRAPGTSRISDSTAGSLFDEVPSELMIMGFRAGPAARGSDSTASAGHRRSGAEAARIDTPKVRPVSAVAESESRRGGPPSTHPPPSKVPHRDLSHG